MAACNDYKTNDTILSVFLLSVVILSTFMAEFVDAVKAPDMTDYESAYKEIDKQIKDNKKLIEDDIKMLLDSDLTKTQIELIEKRIQNKTNQNTAFYNEAMEIQWLNIESYKLDPETQEIFDKARQAISDTYFGKYGVYDLDVENKYRKVLVFVDPDEFNKSDYSGDIRSFITELQYSVNVDVEVHVAQYVETNSTGCSSEYDPCLPAKGGIQISHEDTTGSGSTLGFKAYHPFHVYGFVIAGHEAVSVGTDITQPRNGGSIGTVKEMGGQFCDCAFVKFSSGHYMNDQIWSPDAGSIYPVGVRNTASTPPGTFVMFDGVGGSLKLETVISESSNFGRVTMVPVMGDSGAALIVPQANGKADLYGMMTASTGSYGIYEPYDWIKSELGLSW